MLSGFFVPIHNGTRSETLTPLNSTAHNGRKQSYKNKSNLSFLSRPYFSPFPVLFLILYEGGSNH